MQMQWNILQPDASLVERIQQHLQCHPILARVLVNRKISSLEMAEQFISCSMEQMPSPLLLPNMEMAVDRLCAALQKQEKILVLGDYDADGVTATAVMVSFLQAAGAQVRFHLPHRRQEGYGFHPAHIAQLAAPQGVSLIVTVDCGSSSHEAIAAARRFGIDVIVTDHHSIEGMLPEALAVVNPKIPAQDTSLADLAGVGVAFYLAIALRARLREKGWWRNRPEPNLKALCDLVAIGTIADIVPLKGVNRILTRIGLDQINNGGRPGIQAILAASGVRQKNITSDDVAYRLAPRINAAGRMAHAVTAYAALTACDQDSACKHAEHLNVLNHRRQQIENQMFEEIVARLESRPDLLQRKALLLSGSGWHEGVLGIVASKLVHRYFRPVILIAVQDGVGKGSGRSIPQVDLFAALCRCADLLERFGGHKLAAGLTVRTEMIGQLKESFEAAVENLMPDTELVPGLTIDSEIRLDQIDARLLDDLERLEPFGAENPAPLFLARQVQVSEACLLGQRHRKMMLCQANSSCHPVSAIHFNLPREHPKPYYFDVLAFRLQWNRYRGNKEIQLVVEA